MTLSHTILAATMLLGTATIASANLTVQFVESAPKEVLSSATLAPVPLRRRQFPLIWAPAALA